MLIRLISEDIASLSLHLQEQLKIGQTCRPRLTLASYETSCLFHSANASLWAPTLCDGEGAKGSSSASFRQE